MFTQVSKLHGVALPRAVNEEVVKSPLVETKEPTNSDSDSLAQITGGEKDCVNHFY